MAKEEFIKRGFIPLFDEYVSNCDLVAMTTEGYKFTTRLDNLKSNKIPHLFSRFNKYTIYNINLYLKINEIKYIKLLSDEFENSGSKLTWLCDIHNVKYTQSWSKFRYGNGCELCVNEKLSKERRFSLEDIIKINDTLNPNIKILATNYINAHTELNCTCKIHGGDLKSNWNKLSKGHSPCGRCYSESVSGENNHNYSKDMSGENSPTWKGGITPLHNYLRKLIQPWKIDSFIKYNSTCDITGEKLKNNIIHHLYSFSSILKKTMDILKLPIHQEINKYTKEELKYIEELCLELHYKYGLGVCLTDKVHKELHSYYGGNVVEINEQDYLNFKDYKLNQ